MSKLAIDKSEPWRIRLNHRATLFVVSVYLQRCRVFVSNLATMPSLLGRSVRTVRFHPVDTFVFVDRKTSDPDTRI